MLYASVKRNHQVRILGKIYSAAEEAVAWLGSKVGPSWKEMFRDLPGFSDAGLASDGESHSEDLLTLAGKIDTKSKLHMRQAPVARLPVY